MALEKETDRLKISNKKIEKLRQKWRSFCWSKKTKNDEMMKLKFSLGSGGRERERERERQTDWETDRDERKVAKREKQKKKTVK